MFLTFFVLLRHLSVVLVCATVIILAPLASLSYACESNTRFADFAELMEFLQSENRKNPEYRILQLRYGQDTLAPRHTQYSRSCYFFAIQPVLEYLGYSRFVQGGSYRYLFNYAARDGLKLHRTLDAGYYLSAEHLMAMSIHHESLYNRCEYDGGWSCDPFSRDEFYSDATKTEINTNPVTCSNRFADGQEYGPCPSRSDDYEAWLDAVGNGCGGPGAPCRAEAESGMYWFANQVLQRDAGCNDMRPFRPDPDNYTDKLHMRRVVKGFIDNNLPLLVDVRQGGHFMVLIGYLDLSSNGLPKQAIITDSYGSYSLVSLIDHWNEHDNCSLRELLPWNQHMNAGCESGGWAAELDALSRDFSLCTMPDDWSANCVDNRIYGAEVICEDNSNVRRQYFAYEDDLFISEPNRISCDKVKLRYADGERGVDSVTIQRFWYSADDEEWISGQLYHPDALTTQSAGYQRPGLVSVAEWDSAWPENYWLVAEELSGSYTKRRVTITMTFNDGTEKKIEISPPNTYGAQIDCIDNGGVVSRYTYEADHGVFSVVDEHYADKMFLYESNKRSCDEVVVRVNLGEATNVVSATVQRMYYTAANGEWRAAQMEWWPDFNAMITDGLSGYTREFTWDDAWIDNYWLVGDTVGSGSSYGDRKTVIRLFDGDLNLIRKFDIVPF
jgi:hypothetical protein